MKDASLDGPLVTAPGDTYCPAPCKHHPLSEKYPSGLDLPHAENLERFVRDVSRALKTSYPRTSSEFDRYDKAHCLFLRWEDDDLGTQAEIDELRPLVENLCFTDKPESFTTDQYLIPSEDSFDSLEAVLVSKRAMFAKTSRDLFIIYYGGHGEMNKNRQCIWYPWLSPPLGFYDDRPELDWTTLQDRLRRCEGNILFILDCCYACSMVGRSHTAWNGFKELLVASGKHEKTDGVNDNSFTRALIRELKTLKGKARSISALQATMIENQETHGLKNTPLRIGLSERANRFESLLLVPSQSQSQTSAVQLVDADTMDYGTRVLISIRLRNPTDPLRVKEWTPWLQRQAPKDIMDMGVSLSQIVRPEAAFRHGSSLLFFSIPLTIWNILPHDSAYSFIDIVQSPNLLNFSLKASPGPEASPVPEELPAAPPTVAYGSGQTEKPEVISNAAIPIHSIEGGSERLQKKEKEPMTTSVLRKRKVVEEAPEFERSRASQYSNQDPESSDRLAKKSRPESEDVFVSESDPESPKTFDSLESASNSRSSRRLPHKEKFPNELQERLKIVWSDGKMDAVDQILGISSDVSLRLDQLGSLQKAAQNGRVHIVKRLLKAGVDVNEEGPPRFNGRTALLLATEYGHAAVVDQLLKSGADPNSSGKELHASLPLEVASRRGDSDTVLALLEGGADVEKQNSMGETALQVAVKRGHVGIVKLLLRSEVDVDAHNTKNGKTALHLAAEAGRVNIVDVLLDKMADPNIRNPLTGETPLQVAEEKCHDGVARLLRGAIR